MKRPGEERRTGNPVAVLVTAVLVYGGLSWVGIGPGRPLVDYVFGLVWSIVLAVAAWGVCVRQGWL